MKIIFGIICFERKFMCFIRGFSGFFQEKSISDKTEKYIVRMYFGFALAI